MTPPRDGCLAAGELSFPVPIPAPRMGGFAREL